MVSSNRLYNFEGPLKHAADRLSDYSGVFVSWIIDWFKELGCANSSSLTMNCIGKHGIEKMTSGIEIIVSITGFI